MKLVIETYWVCSIILYCWMQTWLKSQNYDFLVSLIHKLTLPVWVAILFCCFFSGCFSFVHPSSMQWQWGPGDAQVYPGRECRVPAHQQVKFKKRRQPPFSFILWIYAILSSFPSSLYFNTSILTLLMLMCSRQTECVDYLQSSLECMSAFFDCMKTKFKVLHRGQVVVAHS